MKTSQDCVALVEVCALGVLLACISFCDLLFIEVAKKYQPSCKIL